MYAPVSLLSLALVWVVLVGAGYAAMFWASGYGPWEDAIWVSGSSLLTLGFAPVEAPLHRLLAFSEATIGLGIIALLIAFLPTMYGAFSIESGWSPCSMFVRARRPRQWCFSSECGSWEVSHE